MHRKTEEEEGGGGEEEEEEEEEGGGGGGGGEYLFRWQKGRRMFLQHMATSLCVCVCVCVWARREVRTRFWWKNLQKETIWKN